MVKDNYQQFRQYQSPLINRYASSEMLYNFSAEKKFKTWRQVWIVLAETQKQLGLPITSAQIAEMKRFRDKINYKQAETFESEFKHETMAHVHAFGLQCPKAKSIIHLGATSALVTDNADLIIYKDALTIIKKALVNVIDVLARFARRYKNTPTLAYTHFQPALLVTIGKRTCLWLNDLMMDLRNLEYLEANVKCLGAKGVVGTQASFLALFSNNQTKVQELDRIFSKKLGFAESYRITSQTYPRKLDYQVLSVLSGLAQSAHKFSNDIRLLQGLGEMEEPFRGKQIGSSAMAYKRNPIYTERLASLARFIISLTPSVGFTAAQQWLERTLDDSAHRRLTMPEAFLTADAILNTYFQIARGLTVYHQVISKHIQQELPFIVTETILMEAVKSGGDRQDLHEKIRQHSMKALSRIKQGFNNDLLTRLPRDPAFSKIIARLSNKLNPKKYTGLASRQVDDFIKKEVSPVLKRYRRLLGLKTYLKV